MDSDSEDEVPDDDGPETEEYYSEGAPGCARQAPDSHTAAPGCARLHLAACLHVPVYLSYYPTIYLLTRHCYH